MRIWIAVAALALGCSGADRGVDDDLEVAETVTAEVGADEGEVEGLCFRVDATASDLLPTVGDVFVDAVASWGAEVTINDSCDSVLRAEPNPSTEVANAMAVHRPLVKRSETWVPAGLGGVSEIVLDSNAIAEGRLAAIGADECNAMWDAGEKPPVLLSLVLTHESGHLWGLPESESQDDVMFFARRVCTEASPTEEERLTIQSP